MMQQTFRPDESGHLQEQGKRIIIGREESHVSITPEEKGAMEEAASGPEVVQEWWNALDRRTVTRRQSFAPSKHHNGRKSKRDPRRIPKRAA